MNDSPGGDARIRRERSVLKAPDVRRASEPVVVTAPQHTVGGVSVGIVKQGDRAALIEVRCRCGEVIVLECDYGSAPDALASGDAGRRVQA
ncbi:MAG: hypothetical protein HYR85_06350 [Planctomycetes bacterium]|nr:hypothetical protein [Planctomycetota bacterium]MBI3843050.1 hypothetical protein [Planctomycetota bacterium]